MSRKQNGLFMARELMEVDSWKEREGFFLRLLDRYASGRDASIDYTFSVFNHLPIDKRQQLLKRTNYNFFHILLEHDLQEPIYQILNGTSKIERRQMWFFIHENLKEGLEQAILDEHLGGIIYHMNAFPSDKTNKVIKKVLMKDEAALLKTVIRQGNPKIIHYFLEHDLTQKKMNQLGCHIKPSQTFPLNEPHQSTCTKIKNKLRALLRAEVKVCPDSPTMQSSLSTRTERGSSL